MECFEVLKLVEKDQVGKFSTLRTLKLSDRQSLQILLGCFCRNSLFFQHNSILFHPEKPCYDDQLKRRDKEKQHVRASKALFAFNLSSQQRKL